MTDTTESLDIMAMVAEIVAAYVSNHEMEQEKLPSFIQQVHQSLNRLNSKQPFFFSSRSEPAVPVEDSVHPDYIVCLEDGLHLKMLKRHLKTSYNMTPEQYRERWNLPSNYPMVAPNYAKRRSSIAKGIGLGTRRKGQKKVAA
ncbi:MAG: MucR family transcriptional regulator [Proteobacteria bacterium]|nr:MucR family transcriptional regulator [Pseudomonadota bacterium]